mmetsp:Transcript_16651/g.38476  ORF Transcript_16651/g.38476 Transcript_16651/m.38476 type:complete len:175 (+) Transcript_16651:1084-1608(+)
MPLLPAGLQPVAVVAAYHDACLCRRRAEPAAVADSAYEQHNPSVAAVAAARPAGTLARPATMRRPYVVVHMVTVADGAVNCEMDVAGQRFLCPEGLLLVAAGHWLEPLLPSSLPEVLHQRRRTGTEQAPLRPEDDLLQVRDQTPPNEDERRKGHLLDHLLLRSNTKYKPLGPVC